MATQWYVQQDGQDSGPMTSRELKELAVSGRLRPTDRVRKEGMEKWVSAGNVKGLLPARGAAAPAAQGSPPVPAEAVPSSPPPADAEPSSALTQHIPPPWGSPPYGGSPSAQGLARMHPVNPVGFSQCTGTRSRGRFIGIVGSRVRPVHRDSHHGRRSLLTAREA